jgi:uncharacterized SAM-binding protein YcdF (DUF218 family)
MILVLLALTLSLFLVRERIMKQLGDFLVVQDRLQPADVVHVIAGEDFRTDYAFQLYKEGYAEMIFFTGGWCHHHNYDHGIHAREKALAQGIPLASIADDNTEVMSTYMEAMRLKEWIERSSIPVDSIIVVSDPFHMRRASWTYRKVFDDKIQVQMAPVPFELTPYTSTWWTDANSRKYVEDEYLKSIFYLFRYQYSWGSLKDWLSTFDRF